MENSRNDCIFMKKNDFFPSNAKIFSKISELTISICWDLCLMWWDCSFVKEFFFLLIKCFKH